MLRALIAFFLLIIQHWSFAQKFTDPVFIQFGKQELHVTNVHSQTWDKYGRLWMASDEGLACYNGFSTTIYSAKSKVPHTVLSNTIQSVFQDKKGRLWICYLDTAGISRFDPYEGTFKHVFPDTLSGEGFPYCTIVGFKEDSKGRFWILTWDGGLIKMDPESGKCKTYIRDLSKPIDNRHPFGNRVKGFLEMKDGRILLGYFGGGAPTSEPSYFDPEKETFEPFPIGDYLNGVEEKEAALIRHSTIITHFIHRDANENIWIGTYSGLVFLDEKTKKARRVSGIPFTSEDMNLDNARGALESKDGYLWVSTTSSGILRVNIHTLKAEYINHKSRLPSSLADNSVRHLRSDQDGNVWVSTSLGGFSVYIPTLQQFRLKPWEELPLEFSNRSAQNIPANQVHVKSSREIIFAHAKGFTVYDPIEEEVVRNFSIENPKEKEKSYANAVDGFSMIGDTIFFRFRRDLLALLYSSSKPFPRIPSQDFHFGEILFSKKPLFGDRVILSLVRKDTSLLLSWNFQQMQLDTVIRYPSINRSWVWTYSFGTSDGQWMYGSEPDHFYLVDPVKKESRIFGPDSGLHYFPDSTILHAYNDPTGQIWITTENGVYTFNSVNGKSELMNDKIGIGNEAVMTMISDATGVYWFALKDELFRWDPEKKKSYRIDKELGLNVGSFLARPAYLDDKGIIHMVTLNGMLTFDPSRVDILPRVPKLYVERFKVMNDTLVESQLNLALNGQLRLPWNKNSIEIEVYSDQPFAPRKPLFYFRDKQIDTIWQENNTSNKIRLSNLPYGPHELEVKMINAYGVESEILLFSFVVDKPFWITWWFILICILVLATVVYLYIRYREKQLRLRQLILEQKVAERTAEVVEKAEEIRQQKDIIFEKNKELTDSIHYAQRIQRSILPDDLHIRKSLREHFVLFQPKDIVSGDFYWHAHHGDSVLWAVVDCTGHGVPGGFMSMLGSGLLNQIVNEERILQPDQILNELRARIMIALKQTGADGESRDGMDISLCRWIRSQNKLQCAGANNSVYIVRNKQLQELKADKQPIGIHGGEMKDFSLREFQLEKKDAVYLTSDGYTDQFGGEKGKKFKTSNFEKLLLTLPDFTVSEQLNQLERVFVTWKGEFEQLDDVCVFGVVID